MYFTFLAYPARQGSGTLQDRDQVTETIWMLDVGGRNTQCNTCVLAATKMRQEAPVASCTCGCCALCQAGIHEHGYA